MRRATALILPILCLSACTADAEPAADVPGSVGGPAWVRIAESPLGPRQGVVSAWTGDELLIVGGAAIPPCPPGAGCGGPATEQLRYDGAAYDPDTDTWRELASAPASLFGGIGTWTGSELVVVVRDQEADGPARTLVYDLVTDRWRDLGPAPTDGYGVAVWNGDEVFYPAGETEREADWALDPTTGQWRQLSTDPFGVAGERSFTWVGDRFMVTAIPTASAGGSYRLAEYHPEDDRWQLIGRSTVGFWSAQWWYADGRLANVSQNGRTGYDGDTLPPGGQYDLDTGEWAPVPQVRPEFLAGAGCPLPALGVGEGWIGGGGSVLVSLDPPAALHVRDCAELFEPEVGVWAADEIVIWGGPDADYRENLDHGYRWTPPDP